MASVAGEIAKAKKELMFAAAARWAQRAAERDLGLDKLAKLGPGAADSALRQMQFAQREATKAAAGMPMFAERVIGSRDFVAYAPSAQAGAAATPVARITTVPDGGYVAEGVATGLLLPGSLLLTNHHVFPGAAYATGYAANFRYAEDERGVNDGVYFELDPAAFFHSNAQFDFAMVAVKPKGLKGESLEVIGSTRLIEATGKVLVGSALNIIQHPLGGPRKFAISNNRLVDLLPEGFLHYETDTEPGSSGAPVYSNGWELVALHHSAVPRLKNGRIQKSDAAGGGDWDEAHDPESAVDWVANEGVRVSRLVDELRKVRLEGPQQQRLERLIAETSDPFEATTGAATTLIGQDNVGRRMDMTGNLFNFSGPVTLHVYAPQPASPPVSAPEAPSAPAELVPEKKLVFDADYEHRHGYVEGFLGTAVPLPTVVAARRQELYLVRDYKAYFDDYLDVPKLDLTGLAADGALVLPYHHYSLAFNKKFRMCMWTASNCDYRPIERQDARPRKELGGEDWAADPRVPEDMQLKNEDVYGPGKRIDRGHIVRREDNCWGAVGLATDYANSDTYHLTNCTPQHEAFNQENPRNQKLPGLYSGDGQKGIWGQFETAVAKQIEAGGGRAIIFAGPVLKDFFASIQIGGNAPLHIPKQFWKVVVVPEAPKKKPRLLAYGYVFSQVDVQQKYGFAFEALELPKFSKNRIKLADLSKLTGVVFPKVVLDAEQP